jgi:hypothetical protein
MPRLVGKQSNNGLLASLLILIAIAAAIGLEYTGAIDLIPGFGREIRTMRGNSPDALPHGVVYESIQP